VPHGRELAASLLLDLAAAGVPARRVEVVGATLDDVFLHLTGRSLREGTENHDSPATAGASEGAAA
jgi:ABC-2 type transport system ATP-binding protein